jgi:glucose/arabinose dehydrogenase
MRKLLYSALAFTFMFALDARAQTDTLDGAITDLTLTRVLEGLGGPVGARFLPDGRMVIIQQDGGILVYTGTLPLIDAGTIPVNQSSERGLLGIAVDPQFVNTNRLYFYYSAQGTQGADRHRVAWATIDRTTSIVDVDNRTVILGGLAGPANHNGGGIEFGPDGLLYVGVGDTGCNCGCSPGTNDNNFFPTCLTNANGKILRIGRDGEIPPTNPLVGVAAVTACGTTVDCGGNGQAQEADPAVTGAPREEIYAWGFRNPWRFSFDSRSGFLWIGDVGEVTWEEITISQQAGEHHGWPFREGMEGQAGTICDTVTPNASGTACVEPAFVYNHNNNSASVTGGVFANHCSWPAPWSGRYFYGDYNRARVWSLDPNAARNGVNGGNTTVVRNPGGVVHFFEGNDGAIYYVSADDSEIWRIAPTTPVKCGKTDAGVPEDQGVPAPDATEPDLGLVSEAGQPQPDATEGADAPFIPIEENARDGGSTLDAASGGGGGEEDDDCSCTATQGARTGSVVFGLLLSVWVVGRVRRGRRS